MSLLYCVKVLPKQAPDCNPYPEVQISHTTAEVNASRVQDEHPVPHAINENHMRIPLDDQMHYVGMSPYCYVINNNTT